MIYKGILLDIDNTLYAYDRCHKIALNEVFGYMNENIHAIDLENTYVVAKKIVHLELSETASSHNRLLYFQRMCEMLDLNPFLYAVTLYNLYWDSFLESMILFEGVEEFLQIASSKVKICFVTDLTAHIQYRKIEKLGLSQYVKYIVTSEEAGREKPHPYIFLSALQKLGLSPHDVCMIGDNFQKDIVGASSLGIKSIWLNQKGEYPVYNTSLITEVKYFNNILELI